MYVNVPLLSSDATPVWVRAPAASTAAAPATGTIAAMPGNGVPSSITTADTVIITSPAQPSNAAPRVESRCR
jgi:hypothetical protein